MTFRADSATLRVAFVCLAMTAAASTQAACIPFAGFHFEPNKITELQVRASVIGQSEKTASKQWRGTLRVTDQIRAWLQASVAAGCQQIIEVEATGEIGRYLRDPTSPEAAGRYRVTERLVVAKDGELTVLDRWKPANGVDTGGLQRTVLSHDHQHVLDTALAASLERGHALVASASVTSSARVSSTGEDSDSVVVIYEWNGPPALVIYMPE